MLASMLLTAKHYMQAQSRWAILLSFFQVDDSINCIKTSQSNTIWLGCCKGVDSKRSEKGRGRCILVASYDVAVCFVSIVTIKSSIYIYIQIE